MLLEEPPLDSHVHREVAQLADYAVVPHSQQDGQAAGVQAERFHAVQVLGELVRHTPSVLRSRRRQLRVLRRSYMEPEDVPALVGHEIAELLGVVGVVEHEMIWNVHACDLDTGPGVLEVRPVLAALEALAGRFSYVIEQPEGVVRKTCAISRRRRTYPLRSPRWHARD